MAIDMMSPRISFSHDLNQAEFVPIQQHRSDPSLPDSASDFDFCLTYTSVLQDLSTADELFSGGRILPFQLNKSPKSPNPPQAPPCPSPAAAPAVDPKPITNSKERKRLKEFLSVEESDDERPRLTRSSFWQFARSASLNCENSRGQSLIRPLQFLSRSYSTGSEREPAPCSKQTAVGRKDQVNKRQLRKQNSTAPASSNSCPMSHGHHHHRQKPPLNKNYRSYGVDVPGAGAGRVSLVLNLPPQYISKATVGLVGLGSLLCNGKQKKKKKKKKKK